VVPYPGVSSVETMALVEKGYVMEKPELCPDRIYEIMKECWNLDPQKRPAMNEIGKRIGALYRELVKTAEKEQQLEDINAQEPLYNAV
jgi:hypothetical protein